MASFIRISDIPPDEVHLLAIVGLRRQIREDRNRHCSPNNWTNEGEADGSPPDRALPTKVSAVEMSAAAVERFVTDWQLQDELRPSSRLPFDREDIDDEDHDKDDSDDSEDEDAGEEEESFPADDDHQTDDDCDALYVDIGGEG